MVCCLILRLRFPEDSPECLALSGAIKQHYAEYEFFGQGGGEDFCVYLRRVRPWTWHILKRTGRNKKFIVKQVAQLESNPDEKQEWMSTWTKFYSVERYEQFTRA